MSKIYNFDGYSREWEEVAEIQESVEDIKTWKAIDVAKELDVEFRKQFDIDQD